MPTPLDPELVDQIRASLYSGRGVRLSGNDAPTTMLEPSTELTPEGDAFFTGKLDKVAELLDRGFIVNIDSQGAILATTPDHRSRYISTQESDIDVMDRLMVKQALEQGSKVSFERDGSLVIDAVADAAVPTAEVAAARFAEFERLADSGQINSELAEGRDFQFDEAVVPMSLEDPFDTVSELEAEAEALQLGVDAARDRMLPEFTNAKETAELERVAAEGRLAMTKAEEEMALQQAAASGEAAASAAQGAADQRALAQQFRDAGDEARAEVSETDARNLDAVESVHRKVEIAALATADAAKDRVAAETGAVESATLASATVNAHYSGLEQVLDEQQEQVSGARQAAAKLAEAERLEAALPDLEARGVEGTERIRSAITEHRAAAEALVQQAGLRETTGVVVTGEDASEIVEPNAFDPSTLDAEQFDPEQFDPEQFELDSLRIGMIVGPDRFDPPPPDALPAPAHEPEGDDDGTSVDKHPADEEPVEFKPASGPDDFEVKPPSELEAPDGWLLAADASDFEGDMASARDDFASEIADIDELEDDLDGLAEL